MRTCQRQFLGFQLVRGKVMDTVYAIRKKLVVWPVPLEMMEAIWDSK